VEAGKTAQAALAMELFPVWYVAAGGHDTTGTGSEDAPLATVDAALTRISADYTDGDWSNNRGSTPALARIVVSGILGPAEPGTAYGLVDISDTGSMYDTYPPIILEGVNGGTLDAGGSKRVLYVDNADVTLGPGLTLTGGSGPGRGVYVTAGGKFTMTGGTISGNTAGGGPGGGVYVDGGSFTMNKGTISGNNISAAGAGVYITGSGVFTMTGGDIMNNNAASGAGGGVTTYGGNFTMEGKASIAGNEAVTYIGGGVYIGGAGASFTMENFTAVRNNQVGNTAGNYFNGGGVYMTTSTVLNITGGEISGNQVNSLSGIAYGGGVYFEGTSFAMSGGTVSGNKAGYGGGVYVSSGAFTKTGSSTIYGSNALPGQVNTAGSGSGHAVYVYDPSTPKLRNTTADAGVTLDSTTGSPGADPWE
jgi:hypothetical protein